jgi:hypothetical protein
MNLGNTFHSEVLQLQSSVNNAFWFGEQATMLQRNLLFLFFLEDGCCRVIQNCWYLSPRLHGII